MNTLDFIGIASSICPDRDCVVFEGKRYTFSQINERSNRLANSLAGLGIKKGNMAAILQVNCNQFLEIYYALAKLGAILVPLNFRGKEDELTYMLNNCGAVAMFIGDRYAKMVDTMRPGLTSVKHYVSIDGKANNMHYYEDLISSGSPDDVVTDVSDDDVTLLMYTAGTTGRPKGVPMTHNSYGVYVLDNVDPANPDIRGKEHPHCSPLSCCRFPGPAGCRIRRTHCDNDEAIRSERMDGSHTKGEGESSHARSHYVEEGSRSSRL